MTSYPRLPESQEIGILEEVEQNRDVATKNSHADNSRSITIIDGRETKALRVLLLGEIISIYPFISSPDLTSAQSTRVCNALALALLQCVASHPDTRMPFLHVKLGNLFASLRAFGDFETRNIEGIEGKSKNDPFHW